MKNNFDNDRTFNSARKFMNQKDRCKKKYSFVFTRHFS